ncbi:MAG TPA: hypothetical protein VK670_03580 [Silvibacterium sp.]|nr:hypothetical protein [Silvibacterium sp.]
MQAIAVSMNVLEFAEPVLILLALVFFIKSGRTRQFPMMTTYLGLRAASAAMLEVILNLQRFAPVSDTLQYSLYFYTYWSFYAATAIAMFFVIREVFCYLTEPVPGIRRFGLLAFNWVAAISSIISISAALPFKGVGSGLMSVGFQVMRCVSILELCLLAFLALFIHSLGRSFRSLAFGISLGFGLQAAMELISSVVAARSPYLDSNMNFVLQIAITIVLSGWIVYFMLPEPQREREAITLPVSSPLIRWNEIATALGHSSPHVVVGEPGATFLQDVEQVVDKILTKNSISVNS